MATDRHQAPSYPLRMPEDLKAGIARAAVESGRSLHGELLFRLGESFEQEKGEADIAKARLQLSEALTRESIAQTDALFLGQCVKWLLAELEQHNITHSGDIAALAGEAKRVAERVMAYEKELNPDLRLEEYRQQIEEARSLVAYWAPKARPWPAGRADDVQAIKRERGSGGVEG